MNEALTMDYFRGLKLGTVVILHYNLYNKGTFVWIHDHVGPDDSHGHEDDRVWGMFAYSGDTITQDIGSYLYEYNGKVCRGSGAEPVHLDMPVDPTEDDWEDIYR